ncbi:MAG: DUF4258 domain-containing protein [candidate division KSB1 bacterium]|nr:DUF4258 domain-containing protein [candidate division KSB1 bacterium]MDZ7303439.1 DUF4258 domain-containing protein [candidate division KSB1 bacterium]MDZ7312521.1 DUF4258 domain-containing protein [candidate division KSB1 bacterium]
MWLEWWEWELEFSAHVEMRMVDRDFTEIDLRVMYDSARNYRQDDVPGRWVVETKHRRQKWEIIVEPDFDEHKVVIITAYKV